LARYQAHQVTVTITLVGQRIEAAVFSDAALRRRDLLERRLSRVALNSCNRLSAKIATKYWRPKSARPPESGHALPADQGRQESVG
jgi:hypothetical protein